MATKKTSILAPRKLRKLRRDPALYFKDAVRSRAGAMTDLAIRVATRLPVKGFLPGRRRYSVVSAVYQVEPYLDRFFESLVGQTLSFSDQIELIMVDDGSTDGSAAIIERWRSKYPDSIKYIRKENGGQASARNLGLEYVTGDWVTFIDADDFVGQRYFEHIERFLNEHEESDPALLCCKWVFFHERGNRYADNHPLNYRFAEGSFVTLQNERANFMASSASTSFFRADLLAKHGLFFDEEIRPNFEDGHFTGRYLLHTTDRPVGMVADALYYYRKRDDGSSTSDQGWTKPSRFDEVLERGYLALLREGEALHGQAPRSVQRLVLYDLIWYFKKIVDNESSVSFLSAEQKALFRERLRDVFAHIDESTIAGFSLAGAWFFHKVGLLGLYKGAQPKRTIAYVKDLDETKKLVAVSYFRHGDAPVERFEVDGEDFTPPFAKVQSHDFLGETFLEERIAWIPLTDGSSRFSLKVDGRPVLLKVGDLAHESLTLGAIRYALRRKTHEAVSPAAHVHSLRREAREPAVMKRYSDGWLLMDRDTQADDNAEHLYRYILRNRPDINAFFVLSRSSHDWARLQADGFRLVEFGSREHRLLLLNARHVISSHPDSFVLGLLERKWFGDMLDFRFTFLQHGVIRDDISRWLNSKPIDLFVTSSPRETESIVSDHSPYRFSCLQVKQVGLARHDVLLERDIDTEKIVLIIPTWRQYLVSGTAHGTTRREVSPAFAGSRYAEAWKGLLHSERLRRMVEDHGYRVVFFPHANMQLYVDAFDPPPWVEVRTHQSEPILQKLFCRAAVMITDYSSVFFEMGLQDKPVLYYQFDYDEMYGGSHPSRAGYFDFERDGFGPVATTEGELLSSLDAVLVRGAEPSAEYLQRMRSTLPLRDCRNRERTVAAIEALDSPVITGDERGRIALDQARRALEADAWALALTRWQAIDDRAVGEERARALAEAHRQLGRIAEAKSWLEQSEATYGARPWIAVERAELATVTAAPDVALAAWSALEKTDLSDLGLPAGHVAVRRARALRELGRRAEARAELEEMAAGPARSLELGELALLEGHWPEALGFFLDVSRSDQPPCLHLRLVELSRAVEVVWIPSHSSDDGPTAALFQAEAEVAKADPRQARKTLDALAAVGVDGWSDGEVVHFGQLCGALGRLDPIEEAARRSADPLRLEAARLEAYGSTGDWLSVGQSDDELGLSPSPWLRTRARMWRARALAELGREADALRAIDELRCATPHCPSLRLAEAEIRERVGQLDEALTLWRAHLEERPHDAARAYVRVASLLRALGRGPEAREVLREHAEAEALRRLRLEPKDLDALRVFES